MPVFKALAKNIFHLGSIGSGQVCKLVNNLQGYGNEVFARECLNIGLKAGLSFDQMVAAIKVSTGFSKGMNVLIRRMGKPPTLPGAAEKGQPKSIDEKDRDTALELAEDVGAETPITHFMAELDLKKYYDAISQISHK
jgi:3-hydroxyisobutyrate dehydrogenase-like beta-hydroxyacid dehydrogenase